MTFKLLFNQLYKKTKQQLIFSFKLNINKNLYIYKSINQLKRQLTKEERQKQDRDEFIGRQVQKRLLASNILIVNMTTNNTELNKNLILAGANITISDNQIINENDPHTNFLFTKFMIRIKSTQFIGYQVRGLNLLKKRDYQMKIILIGIYIMDQLLQQFLLMK